MRHIKPFWKIGTVQFLYQMASVVWRKLTNLSQKPGYFFIRSALSIQATMANLKPVVFILTRKSSNSNLPRGKLGGHSSSTRAEKICQERIHFWINTERKVGLKLQFAFSWFYRIITFYLGQSYFRFVYTIK
jgi:hypothetical protein